MHFLTPPPDEIGADKYLVGAWTAFSSVILLVSLYYRNHPTLRDRASALPYAGPMGAKFFFLFQAIIEFVFGFAFMVFHQPICVLRSRG